MSVLLVTDPAMERHDTGRGHPERPARLAAAAAGVADGAATAGAELAIERSTPATDEEILRVHSPRLLAAITRAAEAGGGWLDADTSLGPGSLEAARAAAGATTRAARAAAAGGCSVAFAVVRPPGHHASRERAAGFCLLNNVAIAVEAVRGGAASAEPLRVAILDWDVHHGDGTQAIYDTDPSTSYASTHEWGIYPGTGALHEMGSGAALGTMHNRPLPAGTGDEVFVRTWTDDLLPAIEAFRPAALLISAGYDAHREDPLAGLAVTEAGYRAVAEAVGTLATRCGLPGIALALEGGYDLDAIRGSVAATVSGLLAGMASG